MADRVVDMMPMWPHGAPPDYVEARIELAGPIVSSGTGSRRSPPRDGGCRRAPS